MRVQYGLNSIVILGSWTLWMHRNHCVFYGTAPKLADALLLAKEEAQLWCLPASGAIIIDYSRAGWLVSHHGLVCGRGHFSFLCLWSGLRHAWFLDLGVCVFGFDVLYTGFYLLFLFNIVVRRSPVYSREKM